MSPPHSAIRSMVTALSVISATRNLPPGRTLLSEELATRI